MACVEWPSARHVEQTSQRTKSVMLFVTWTRQIYKESFAKLTAILGVWAAPIDESEIIRNKVTRSLAETWSNRLQASTIRQRENVNTSIMMALEKDQNCQGRSRTRHGQERDIALTICVLRPRISKNPLPSSTFGVGDWVEDRHRPRGARSW